MHLFLAQDVRAGAAHPEADERISVRAFSKVELLQMMRSGRIVDGKTLVGVPYWLQLNWK
jgi:ADP-ribose pyrophosphatase